MATNKSSIMAFIIAARNMLTPQHFDFLNDQTTHENDKTTEKQKSKILD
jgi:hypothetical protein